MFRKTCLVIKKVAAEKNLFYKALSVVLAVLLWFFAASEPEMKGQEKVFDQVPVQVRGLKESMLLLEEPAPVQVVLRGAVSGISSHDLTAFVNLSGVQGGEVSVPVQVEVPAGVTVAAVKPARIKLSVDRWAEKQLPLNVELQGTPQPGYRVLTPTVKPSQVVLRGAETTLARVQEAAAVVDVDRRQASFEGVLPVRLIGAGGTVMATGKVECVPATVEVVVPVIPEKAGKTVAVQLQLNGSLPGGLQVARTRVEPETVKVYGADTALLALEKISTAPLELGELAAMAGNGNEFSGERSMSFSLPLVLPPGVEAAEPEKVLVTVVVNGARGGGNPAPNAEANRAGAMRQ